MSSFHTGGDYSDAGSDTDSDTSRADGGFRVDYEGDGTDDSFSLTVFGRSITVRQMPSDRLIGHGAVVWEAAVVFAKYMEYGTNKDLSLSALQGKNVLELGSGPGLGGMVMVLRGARVTLTDLACVTEALTFANTRRFYKQLRSEGSVRDVTIHHPRVFSLDWTDLTGVQTMLEQAAPVDSPGARPTARPQPLPLGVVAEEEEDFAATATETSVTTEQRCRATRKR